MSGKTLLDTQFLELLPQALRQDEDVIAFSKTVDVLWSLILPQIRNIHIWSRIDELEEPLLSTLAHQMHLEGYEGWHLATTLDQKRRLIKDAYKTHFYKGTRWSLERTFELLDIPGEVTEWWESDEGAETFPPYTFDMDIFVHDRKITQSFYYDALGLIDALKNLRSHLRRGTVHVEARGEMHVNAGVLCRSKVTIYPLVPTRVEISEDVPVINAGSRIKQTVTVPPLVPSAVEVRDAAVNVNAGGRTKQKVTVYPMQR